MQNIDGDERMCLRCMPLGWPCGGVEAIHAASPDTACPGLHRKPLDATTIGQLLAPYCPSGCRGNNKQNNNVKIVHYAGSFNGCGGLWRRAGTIMCALTDEGGSWLSQKPLNATIGQALTPTASIGFGGNLWKRAWVAWITIGVWHINLMRSTYSKAEYFVGVVKLKHFIIVSLTNNQLKYLKNWTSKNS